MGKQNIDMKTIGKIEIAIMKRDINSLKQTLNNNLECLSYADSSEGTLLHFAAEEGNIEAMKYLLSLGIDINKRAGGFDANALVSAISAKQYEAAKYLIDEGIEIDTSTSLRNPLISAIYNRQLECVKLLIEKGIDVNKTYIGEKTGKRFNALTHARTYGTTEILEVIEKEVNLTLDNNVDNGKNHDKLIGHIEKYIGSIDETIGKIIPGSKVRVTINIIRPTKERNYITLVTSGMSECSMGYSEKDDEYKYAELIMKLPSEWKIDMESYQNNSYAWPLKLLRKIAHLPHQSEGYLNDNVIIPNGIPGDAPLPYDLETWLSAVMICKSEVPTLEVSDEIKIDFFTLVPICDEEVEEARKLGNNNFMNTLPCKDILDEKRGYED